MIQNPDRTSRDHVLTGQGASEWLAERGLTGSTPSHLIADEIAVPGFRVARVWHSAAVLERERTPGVLFAVLIADGDGDAAFGGTTCGIATGDLVVAPADGALEIRTADRIARFEFEIRADEVGLVPAVSDALARGVLASDAAPSFRPVLLATMNAAFNAGLGSDSSGFTAFRLATTSLLAGLLDETLAGRSPGRSAREAVLHRRALDAIAVHALDPSFSAAELARCLSVSERHLRRIFEAHGTTPAGALRDARLARARTFLAASEAPVLAEAARSAGFRSPRALRRATAHRQPSA